MKKESNFIKAPLYLITPEDSTFQVNRGLFFDGRPAKSSWVEGFKAFFWIGVAVGLVLLIGSL